MNLGASLGQYGTLRSDLKAQGFRFSKDEFGGPRFVKEIGDFTIPVDFLTEHPPATRGTAILDDVPTNILPCMIIATKPISRDNTGQIFFALVRFVSLRAKKCQVKPRLGRPLILKPSRSYGWCPLKQFTNNRLFTEEEITGKYNPRVYVLHKVDFIKNVIQLLAQ